MTLPAFKVPVDGPPLISAHRGAGNMAPENTLAAFEAALEKGATMIELDVHLSSDGVPMVIHDVTTARTTGKNGYVSEQTRAELQGLDAGSWFGPGHAGQRIPSFEDILDWAKDRVYLNVDVRNYPGLSSYDTGLTARAVTDAVARTGMLEQAVIQCLDHQLAVEVRRRRPDAITGITFHGRAADLAGMARTAGATLISGDAAFSTGEVVAGLHAAGIGWMTTAELRLPGLADNPDLIAASSRRLRDIGTDIIVTDDVDATLAALREGTA
ncbi:glycerophosphodiester phosphodiesterase [Pseudarthrobacter sp. NPDC092424]|uniref:glycerophosphodiester phosphodiesterase n=1 Tax=Pseudarthrobacter sp. NPDC092424 TaxID=3364415 RepID=UPI003815EEE2